MITRTVSELAAICEAVLEGDGERRVVGPASLGEAGEEEISFLANERYAAELETTRAAAVLVPTELAAPREGLTLLRCANPSRAFTRVIELFRPEELTVEVGIHPSAVVEEGAEVDPAARVGALAFVGRGSVIAAGAVIHPHVVVGPDCRVGEDSVLDSGAVLTRSVEIGRRCRVHGGTVLGGDGFGFEPVNGGWEKIPQCGRVVLEDDVEIGANSTVDRARFGATRILAGTKIDDHVHVAHNVSVGPGALLVAQTGISGSSKIGRGVILAGQTGVSGHVEIGDGARIGSRAAVMKSVPGGQDYLGTPARPKNEHLRSLAHVRQVPALERRIRELEERLARLEAGSSTDVATDGGA